ncbi:type I restriction endonuclease subunit R [Corynebacterium sp. S7]
MSEFEHLNSPDSQPGHPSYNVAETEHSTVIASFDPSQRPRPKAAQSEAELEEDFLTRLTTVGYERVTIRTEDELVSNLRRQLERLNKTEFSDAEWTQVFDHHVANPQHKLVDRTRLLQTDPRFTITRDDGTQINVMVLDKRNLMVNHLQVTNQYTTPTEGGSKRSKASRYDVTVLINGLPMVHVELKRRGVKLREAFNQISRYQSTSFIAGSKLFEYVQLYVISNGTDTKYYSNTTRDQVLRAANKSSASVVTQKSFAFTSYWADAKNRIISDLASFAETFMPKRNLLNILTRYCVFDSGDNLMVMRPYQIAATEKILNRITATTNTKLLGTAEAGGYIWHTTGSGKTLTSFKTAQLATEIDGIDKVIFAVDRQDLDYQTVKEYERFQKGSVSSNTSTTILAAQLGDPEAIKKVSSKNVVMSKIIVTTIQKLNAFVHSKAKNSRYPGRVVLIFDECHRSQFGSMHKRVSRYFNKRHSFGFTGTPIFDEIARRDSAGQVFTTGAVFGDRLHTYTIVDAIKDANVLKFKVDSNETMTAGITNNPAMNSADREIALRSPARISAVVTHVLESFTRYTKRQRSFTHTVVERDLSTGKVTQSSANVFGFNALFAASSIAAARSYYAEFARQQQEAWANDQVPPLRVAMIYSSAINQEAADQVAGNVGEENMDELHLSEDDRTALESAIEDYNSLFGTSFSASATSFANYYKDLSQRIRNRQIDLVIVVNMFLTGFDAPALNTLFVDKNLKHHGLIQAFSRTNRIINPIKDAGMIVTYRDLSEQTDEALEMFGDSEKVGRLALVRPYSELLAEYVAGVEQLHSIAEPGEHIYGNERQKRFVQSFSAILRLHNVLSDFEQFDEDNPLNDFDLSDYMSRYLDIRDQQRSDEESEVASQNGDIEPSGEQLEFEIELVRHISVDVDYIISLVEKARAEHSDGRVTEDYEREVERMIDASPKLRPKKELILEFLNRVNGEGFDGDLNDYLRDKCVEEVQLVVTDKRMKTPEAYAFIAKCFQEGKVAVEGTALIKILPKMSLFAKDNAREIAKREAAQAIESLVERFGEVVPPEAIRALQEG